MALPKLNVNPSYECTVPSTGNRVAFRPYLVKEEKVLMMAMETQDQKQALRAIVDTIDACVTTEGFSAKKLTTFDIEYLFTQIRSKSVGEKSTILMNCQECDASNEYQLDISEVKVEKPNENNLIELSDSVSVEMRYPMYENVSKVNFGGKDIEIGFAMVGACIQAVITEDERIEADEISKTEINEFLESMTQGQFKKLAEYLESLPALRHNAEFTCIKCGAENQRMLRGMADFLS